MLSLSQTEEVIFTPALVTKFNEIVSRYPEGKQKSALLPILHLVQAEYGWVSVPAMDKVAGYLDLKPIFLSWHSAAIHTNAAKAMNTVWNRIMLISLIFYVLNSLHI